MAKILYTATFASEITLSSKVMGAIVKTAKEALKTTPLPILILESYANSTGDEQRNAALTVRRGELVKSALEQGGFPSHKILIRARGEREFERPGLPKAGALSRRVEIVEVQ